MVPKKKNRVTKKKNTATGIMTANTHELNVPSASGSLKRKASQELKPTEEIIYVMPRCSLRGIENKVILPVPVKVKHKKAKKNSKLAIEDNPPVPPAPPPPPPPPSPPPPVEQVLPLKWDTIRVGVAHTGFTLKTTFDWSHPYPDRVPCNDEEDGEDEDE
ncbi:hypothetical protein EUX98_g2552 [Antrodiella citrinella]|uniref:Uncharacterized protein n=1 Tax=Antrodiella citrinella TaxID=2447956 RepID=A0A4S4N0Y1_9APHY|nr:hypothetical protein EUX98_g2552 [Antrodiella citrinella]